MIINKGQLVAGGTPTELRERITGETALIAEMRGPLDDITTALRGMDGVTNVTCRCDGEWVHATVATENDVREKIAELAASKQWPLRELRREVASLEDFFVKIVAGASETAA